MDRAARRAAAMGEKKEGGGAGDAAAAEGGAGAAASRALQQCGQLQKLIDISIGSLRGLRTKCAVSNDLTQQEIRTLEAKLVRYICKQRQCKLSVAPGERTPELDSYPRFSDWLYTFNVRPEVAQEILRELTLDALLDMNEAKVKETLRGCGASAEECGRLQYALTCLRKVTGLDLPHGSPQMVQRDIGISVTHRFSTKSWLSQVCHVCQKSMMFGVKCKHCRLKCHNKCTKEAPACRISFLPIARIRRTESVPSDINNPVVRAAEPHFGTLPKALTKKEHPPAINHLDSSSNPSSTTSSTPSSPAPFPTSSNPSSATTPPNPSPGQRDSRFNFPAAYFIHHRQQFIFPDISAFPPAAAPFPEAADSTRPDDQPKADVSEDHEVEAEEPEAGKSEAEDDEDEVDDLPSARRTWRGPISRKASQTSVYLQEWDIPFEQVELGEPIGQGRWGRVHRGRWHGEVAIRLLEMDGHNQDHLKLFKKEVMNYRQTRHENVVLFMGACMNPPHLAIITSFCKGRTLHSFVRDPKTSLDINKTRQIAQEIIKGMGYLHAKGIVHKDLKSKNVFYDNGKVVITDFGLFGMSGVVREGRRENQLKLSHDWLCYLAPEIVREMTPGKEEDQLPFSKAADVYAFGTVWYELQARDWPFKNQAAEALIWQIGSGEGMKRVLASVSLGKEVTEILSACWAFDLQERPSFTLLMDMLEKLPKLNRRLSHPGHFWKSADRWRSRYYGKGRDGHPDFKNPCPVLEEYINSSKVVPRFERFGLGALEAGNPKM
ncbi:kinase suppressor of Ras 1 isoform X13 [Pipistrellus kuhlii]|uniref:kinase suppressor of Ras 1 isoform X13 n=1 Tax=Pipistrellus kuhlii TaxID=59472 RepID=UPI00174F0F57|nr:kinase suppressor of Ras 1 isoform X13 [Pipistrellus kuhlii]